MIGKKTIKLVRDLELNGLTSRHVRKHSLELQIQAILLCDVPIEGEISACCKNVHDDRKIASILGTLLRRRLPVANVTDDAHTINACSSQAKRIVKGWQ